MSFRRRLLLFFLIIVLVPMIAVAVVLLAITADSEMGKADARIGAGLRAAFALYGEGRDDAAAELDRVVGDDQLAPALATGDVRALKARLTAIDERSRTIVSMTFYDSAGRPLASVGRPEGVAAAAAVPAVPGRGRVGILAVSVTDATALARRIERFTGLEARIRREGRMLGSTLPEGPAPTVDAEEIEIAGASYRGRADFLPEVAGPPVVLGVYDESAALSASIQQSRFLIALLLIVFLLAAFVGSQRVVSALQGRLVQLLEAARRLSHGDFSRPVPIEGRDEFAALGIEFNRMSEELAGTIDEVQRQRDELGRTIRLVGDAFATGLDRQGSVDVAVRTAVEACSAAAGRVLSTEARTMRPTFVGTRDPDVAAGLEAAEGQARARLTRERRDPAGTTRGPDSEPADRSPVAESHVESVHALAVMLRARLGAGAGVRPVAMMSIARREARFSDAEREIFGYLAGQAAVSLENASLHETVQLQAVTDELTGLHNARQFHRTLTAEIERSHRFRNDVGLVIMDLDDFKQVNDGFGHQQGDLVLVEVARVIETQSRDIDEVARYGGEELAVILPQADSEGAAVGAERLRQAVNELQIPRLDGVGTLSVTASFGAASLLDSATDKDGLIAAADAALYRSKRAGKNRVERAERVVTPR
ncbi:MAG: diguanylate cyclase [Thermoleophilaceae bacterium]